MTQRSLIKPTAPLGQLPLLAVDGKVFVQSMAIARYASRLTGLYPVDALEALKVDMLVDSLLEGLNKFIEYYYYTPDEAIKTEKIKSFTEGGLPKMFGLLETEAQGKFFLGEKASIADVFLYDLYNNGLKVLFTDFKVAAFPKAEAIMVNVASNAGVAAYLAKHQ